MDDSSLLFVVVLFPCCVTMCWLCICGVKIVWGLLVDSSMIEF